MRTKKIRLGLAMAALSVIVSGSAVVATEAAAWAGSETGAVMEIPAKSSATAPTQEAASLAGFDWS